MAREHYVNMEQFALMKELGLVIPFTGKKDKREIKEVFNSAIVNAKREGDTVKVEKIEKYLANMQDNIVFARLKHPQETPLLLCQSCDENDNIRHGFVFTPGAENYVLDLGRVIVTSDDNSPEKKYMFESGELFATSEKAANMQRFKTKELLIEKLIDEAEETSNEELSEEELSRIENEAEKLLSTIEIMVLNIVEMTKEDIDKIPSKKKRKEYMIGQQTMQFEMQEKVIETPTTKKAKIVRTKSNIYKNVLGDIENPKRMEDVVVCKKIIPTMEYLLEVEMVFYNDVKIVHKIEEDDDGFPIQKEIKTTHPSMDCIIHAYEIAIELEREYDFDKKIIEQLKEIKVNGESLVSMITENGCYLHTFDTMLEDDAVSGYKEDIVATGVKKGELKKIISYAEIMSFAKERKINFA